MFLTYGFDATYEKNVVFVTSTVLGGHERISTDKTMDQVLASVNLAFLCVVGPTPVLRGRWPISSTLPHFDELISYDLTISTEKRSIHSRLKLLVLYYVPVRV